MKNEDEKFCVFRWGGLFLKKIIRGQSPAFAELKYVFGRNLRKTQSVQLLLAPTFLITFILPSCALGA